MGHRFGSDAELLWLWRRPEATAPIGPLAWEPPYAWERPKKSQNKKNPKKNLFNFERSVDFQRVTKIVESHVLFTRLPSMVISFFFWPHSGHMESASNLSHSCGNTRSLTHCARLGIKSMPPQRKFGSLTHCTTVELPTVISYTVGKTRKLTRYIPFN